MAVDIDEGSLNAQGRALVEALGGRWERDRGMCRCPAHDDRTPSLSVRLGRSRLLLHCFAGCDTGDILRELRRADLLSAAPGSSDGHDLPKAAADRVSGCALRVWGASVPIGGTLAERYLDARGLAPSPELRFHPRTPHGRRPLTRFRPAMIAAVREDAGLVAVHRTFLDPRRGAEAGIAAGRAALGPLGAGAVRLGAAAPVLGLAEGIETALAVWRLFGIACWATLGTERFARVELPACVERLLLFLDNDHGGRRAEALAREAFARLDVAAHYPPLAGADWNDVVRAQDRARSS